MPNNEFLETYPLYRKVKTKLRPTADHLPYVPIKMKCDRCKSDQTFNMINPYHEMTNILNMDIAGETFWLRYQCMSCKKASREFFIKIDEKLEYIVKIGQDPAWDIAGDKNIEGLLGSHSDYYRRGLICESQNYGIAAFAYYRRIVEKTIDKLLDQIGDLMVAQDKLAYESALEKTKHTRVAANKIELVKDLLPPILRPNDMNPLSLLHETLSEGLHAEGDEQCLDNAAEIRKILVFLTTQITASVNSARAFSESMKTLLDKKSKK
jgi:hypothetical protein